MHYALNTPYLFVDHGNNNRLKTLLPLSKNQLKNNSKLSEMCILCRDLNTPTPTHRTQPSHNEHKEQMEGDK